MKHTYKIKKTIRKVRTHKIRNKITFAFFIILFGGIVISGSIIFLLNRLGISLHNIRHSAFGIFIICMICFVLSSAASYFTIRQIFEPMEQISKASKKVSKGDYSVQLTYNGNLEEFKNTIDNFNRMVHELNSVEIIRNDFIANVSHEFKTPLSSINGYVMLLQDSDLTEEERNEYVQKIFFNIEKLNHLTENILRLSKLENQNYLSAPVQYRLDEQIREAIVLLEPKWSSKDISFNIDLPEFTYTGQKSLLFQVWSNLLSNAIKFSNMHGEVSVTMNVKNNRIRVTVSDNGIGMTPETQKHIFDKFYQGDTSHRSQGNGLGLALCKEILEKCNGKIYVTSESGQGSVFAVILNMD